LQNKTPKVVTGELAFYNLVKAPEI